MIISPHFIWVHVPKTGGTWLRGVLERGLNRYALGKVIYPGHHRLRDVPQEERIGRPVLWVVRNPWDWHVSYYHFWRTHWEHRTGSYSLPVDQWTGAQWEWDTILKTTDSFAAALPAMVERKTLWGVLQYLILDDNGAWPDSLPCHFERMRTEVVEFLGNALGRHMPGRLKQELLKRRPENISPHGDYRGYYTAETRELVARAESELIERFGYDF